MHELKILAFVLSVLSIVLSVYNIFRIFNEPVKGARHKIKGSNGMRQTNREEKHGENH